MSLDTLLNRVTKQTMVIWPFAGSDGYGGSKYDDPKEMKARWAEEAEVLTDNNGQEFISRARILVTADITHKSRVMLGELDDLTQAEQDDPVQIEDSWEIRKVDRKPRLGDSKFTIYEAWI